MPNPFANMSKPAIYATVIGGTGVVGYVLYLRHQQTGSWNPFSAGAAAASDGATPDASVATTTDDSSDLGTDAGGGTGDLLPTGSSGDLSGTSEVTGTYASTAQWAQAAQAGLTSIGYDPTTVAAALGAYIAEQPLTAAQESIVEVAVSEYGRPDGANGMPLQILTQPATSATAVVPNVIGQSVADADSAITAAGLVPGAHSTGSGTVNGQTPTGGTHVASGSKVDLSVGAPTTPTGNATVVVPNVTGHNVGAANDAIKAAGLVPGAHSTDPGSDMVNGQTPKAGAKVKSGSKVDLSAETADHYKEVK